MSPSPRPGVFRARALVRPCLAVLASFLLSTCSDEPTAPPLRLGVLAVRPAFPANALVGGLVLDTVQLYVVRPPADTVARVGRRFAASSSQLQIQANLLLTGTSETFDVTLELYAGTILLFRGTAPVLVTAGQATASVQVPVSYQGPGVQLTSLNLQPRDTVVTAGGQFSFRVTAADAQQNPVSQFYVTWSSNSSQVVIDGAGGVVAPVLRDTVLVTVTAPNQVSDQTNLIIMPRPSRLAKAGGDQQQGTAGSRLAQPLAVQVFAADNLPVPGVQVTFGATSGGGSVDNATVITDGQGIAQTGVVLGSSVGTQTFSAAVAGVGSVSFSATATTFSPIAQPLAVGNQHACELRSGAAFCWGDNRSGQLGDGTTTPRTLPVAVSGGNQFVAITAGDIQTCALTAQGQAFCWGGNTSGELGNGTTNPSLTPTAVSGGQQFVEIRAGFGFTCARSTQGEIFCWGQNGRGQFGNGSTSPSTTPVPTGSGLAFTAVSAFADNHVCGLVGSQAYCMGYNFDGAIGDGSTTDRTTPTLVSGGQTWSQISSGYFHTCALAAGGQPFCWGDNNVGQVGDGGQPTDRLTPVAVSGGFSFSQIAAGGPGGCGITTGGAAVCWGLNTQGTLGDGTTTSSPTPVAVVGGLSFVRIAMGNTLTCGQTASATYCWGNNSLGQIGDGTNIQRLAPQLVGVPAPTQIAVSAGDNQSATAGTAVAVSPAVLVTDAFGSPVANVSVTFAAATGGGSVTGAVASTNASGIATVGSWTLGATPGTNTLTATAAAAGIANNPVTFTALGTAPTGTFTWTGTLSTDWFTAGNWSPASVPTATDDAVIPTGTSNAPVLATPASIRNLTVANGVTLDLGGFSLTASGNVNAGTTITNGTVVMTGNSTTVQGTLPNLLIATGGTGFLVTGVSAAGPVNVAGDLNINSGRLVVGTQTVSVSATFSTANIGILDMQQGAGQVIVAGDANFAGEDPTNFLTAGTFFVAGSFTQTTALTQGSFVASGTHRVVLNGSGTQTVVFGSPGGIGGSHFADFEIAKSSGTVVLGTSVTAIGRLLEAQPSTQTLSSSAGQVLTIGGISVSGVVFDNVLLAINGAAITQFDNASFINQSPGATALAVGLTGGAFSFTNLSFGTTPTTGFYLVATDLDGSTNGFLTINMVAPTPATPGPFLQQNGGAVVNWPAAGPATWTGAVSTDWSDPGNWSTGQAPTAQTDVTITAGPTNQPVLTVNSVAQNVTGSVGASLDLSGHLLALAGSIDWQGTMAAPQPNSYIQLSGAFGTAKGNLSSLRAFANNSVSGPLNVAGDLVIGSGGGLIIGGNTVNVGGILHVADGLLIMTNPSDVVVVAGNGTFDGLDETNFLTEGQLRIGGNFLQLTTNSLNSFVASGNHNLVKDGPGLIALASPGAAGAGSHFFHLTVACNGPQAVSSNSTLPVEGRFQITECQMSLGGNVTVGDYFRLSTGAQLTVNGHTMSVTNDMQVTGTSLLVMTNPADHVVIGTDAFMDGGNQLGLLDAGQLDIGGNLTQANSSSNDAFHTSGTHVTFFTSPNPQITFASPGNVPGSSHFEQFAWGGGGTLTLGSDVYAHQGFTVSQNANIISSGHKLQIGGLTGAGITFDNTPLVLDMPTGGPLGLSSLTFQNMDPTTTQLTVNHTGAGGPFSFTGFSFLTTPTTGLYLSADDVDGPSSNGPLTIDMVAANPSAPASNLFQGLNGAVVNWPSTGPGITWTGASSTNWQFSGNWSPAQVPTSTDDVLIPDGAVRYPLLTANANVRNLTVQSAALVTLGGFLLNTFGDVAADGPVIGGTLFMAGSGQVQGNLEALTVTQTATLSGPLIVTGATSVQGSSATLDVNSQGASLGSLTVQTSGLVSMTDPQAAIAVVGDVLFQGNRSTAGFLTGGTLQVGGNFTEQSGSFEPSGNQFFTVLAGTNPTVTFSQPGVSAGQSHFTELLWSGSGSGTLTLGSNVFVLGGYQQGQIGTIKNPTPATPIGLDVGGVFVGSGVPITFDGVALTVRELPGIQPILSDLTFTNQNPAGKQLTVIHSGAFGPFTWTNLVFNTTPTSGFYVSATDPDGATNGVLTIDVVNATPLFPGNFLETAGGAVVNWPAAGPGIFWNGSVSTDWFNPLNWNGNQVPGSTDDVVIPVTTNRPDLTINTTVHNLTVAPNSTLNLALNVFLTINGNLVAGSVTQGGQIVPSSGSTVQLAGTGTMSGVMPEVLVTGDYTANGFYDILGNLTIGGPSGRFDAGSTSGTVENNFSTVAGGVLVMTKPGILNSVGNVVFDGGDESGLLNDGFLHVGGDFAQLNTGTGGAKSFSATGTHMTQFLNLNASIGFVNSGAPGVGSGFGNVRLSCNGSAIDLTSDVYVSGTFGVDSDCQVTLFGTLTVVGDATVDGIAGLLDLGGNSMSASSFTTGGGGVLLMLSGTDHLTVGSGGAVFGSSGDETGKLQAGTITVNGPFQQLGTANTNFVATGAHRTELDPAFSVQFDNPGLSKSHFAALAYTGPGTLTLNSPIAAEVFEANDGTGGVISGQGFSVTANDIFGPAIVFDNVPLVIDGSTGAFSGISGAAFQNIPTDQVQLTVIHPGSAAGGHITIDGVLFSPLTSGDLGFYIDAIDPDGPSVSPLVVDVTNSNQSPVNGGNGPSFSTSSSGQATINWP